jgi:hypothetical protein
MIQLITDAIHQQSTLRFSYKGAWREVEPHTYGRMASGEDGICAWQQAGGSGAGYRLFLTSQLSALSLGESFDGSRPDYHRGDQRFVLIYAEL